MAWHGNGKWGLCDQSNGGHWETGRGQECQADPNDGVSVASDIRG